MCIRDRRIGYRSRLKASRAYLSGGDSQGQSKKVKNYIFLSSPCLLSGGFLYFTDKKIKQAKTYLIFITTPNPLSYTKRFGL